MHLLIPIAANLVLGVVLVALFVARRRVDDARLADADAAVRVFRVQFPDADGTATVTADQRAALIVLSHGAGIGLLQRRGRRWIARQVRTGDIRSVGATGDDALRLSLADFGWPRAEFRIADATARAAWLARLESLATRRGERHAPESTHA